MKTIILFFSLILTISCNSNDDNSEFQSTEITFTEIGKAFLTGNSLEGVFQLNHVITNQTDWENIIEQMDLYGNVSNNFTEINIDFDNYIVIAVFDIIRPDTGYSIEINNIIEEVASIIVNYSEQSVASGFTVLVQPFHIVKILKTNKEIVFE